MTERMHGWHPDGKAPCYPSKPMLVCATCARHRTGYPTPPEQRMTVVIDASLVMRGGICQMHERREVLRPYCEPVELESA